MSVQVSAAKVWYRVAAVYMISFAQMLDISVANLALVHISADLHMDVYYASWVVTSFMAGVVIAFPIPPFLLKRLSEDYVFFVGAVLFMLTSAACSLTKNPELFLMFRFLQGLSTGATVVLSQSLFFRLLGDENRRFAVALTASTIAMAPVFGPFIGSIVTQYLGWQWIFMMNVPIFVISLLCLIDFFNFRVDKTAKVPFTAILTLCSFAVVILSSQYIFDFGERKSWFASPTIVFALYLSIFSFIVFMLMNNTRNGRIFDFSLFKNIQYSIATWVLALGNGIIFSSLVFLPVWLQADYGLSMIHAGAIVSIASGIAAILAPLIGKYMPGKYYPHVSCFSLLFTAISFYMMADFTLNTPPSHIIMARIVAGIGMGTFAAPLIALSMEYIPKERFTDAYALSSSIRLSSSNVFIALGFAYWHRLTEFSIGESIADSDRFTALRGLGESPSDIVNQIYQESHTIGLDFIMMSFAALLLVAVLFMLYLLVRNVYGERIAES